ncbi:MAG: hypothetical protein IIV94_10330 [Clostridiales bacterium]|nr:hypothetical protein [Clostridiales bacterium]
MNEFKVKDELTKQRQEINTFEELTEFLKNVKENYNCGYGEAPRAIAQASLAVAWYLASEFGITGFQAGFVMWDFIRDWQYSYNKAGLKIVDYDDMLYPQHHDKFEKTIRPHVWEALRKEAAERLKEVKYAHPSVVAHWQSIVGGKIPFGYSVKDD